MAFLFLTDDEALLLDAGTGVARLLEQHVIDLLRPYDCLNVILSHYHIDHVVGLSYFPETCAQKRIRLYAPARPFVETSPEEALNTLLRPPLFSLSLRDFPMPVEVVPVTRESLQIGTLSIQLRAQKHPGGSAGIRIEDTLAYVTDTIVEQATQTFAQGVELLLHEVWLTDAEVESDEVKRPGHSYAGGVARIAMQAGVSRLMPVHHHPRRPDTDIRKLAHEMQEHTDAEVIVPEEGKVYELS
jgi:ribonuclease BN (tRNA processing enzyme)